MFDISETRPTVLSGAQIVTPKGLVEGTLAMEGGRIAGFGTGISGDIDLSGQYLIPGIVDIHTDHVEKHVYPRSGVRWNIMAALMAHDAVVVSGGTTTVFDSLSVGVSATKTQRREMLAPLIDGIERGMADFMFRAEHILHLRCELADPATLHLVDENIGREIVGLVSVMDHTPGDRQCHDIEAWLHETCLELRISEEDCRVMMEDMLHRAEHVAPKVRAHILAQSKARGLSVLSHDDRTLAHVDQAVAEGVTVSEFPTTIEAARHARAKGLKNVAGAPNFLRGGSQSGNVAVKDLLAEGLVDILASDYVPRSPLDAAFAIAADSDVPLDLPGALGLVTEAPAKVAGLSDRGRIAEGLRADLVAVRLVTGQPQVTAVWRQGQRVF